MEYKVGDVLACKNNGFISSVIRNVSHSKYSHIAVYIGNGLICEADGITGHVRYRNISYYKNKADIYTLPSLTDEQRNKIVEYMESKVGLKYDRLLLLWLFIKYTLKIRLPYKNDKSVICSEICNDAYKSVGVRLSGKRFPIPDDIIKKLTYVSKY